MNRLVFIASVRRLCLTLWVGGELFFALALAPLAFRVLPDRHAAGSLVGASLTALHWIAFACGGVLLATALPSLSSKSGRFALGRLGAVIVMLGLTAYSQFVILPRMKPLRALGPASQEFQSLHQQSVWLESGVLLLGLALVLQPEPVIPEASLRR